MNKGYSIDELVSITKGKLFPYIQEANRKLIHLVTDSRKVIEPASSLFVALTGERNDGHKYISEMINAGVKHFLVSKLPDDAGTLHANFLLVDNTLKSLQALAEFHRQQFSYPVIGITGSNGKTIVKEWLFQLLNGKRKVVRSPKSYNSQVGVPLSVWEMEQEHEIGIFEAGISHPGEMKSIERIIRPTIGIFTNLGPAHQENFKDLKEKAREKFALLMHCQTVIFCKDYPEITEMVSTELNPTGHGTKLFSWSRKSNATLVISKVSKQSHGTRIQGIYKNDFIEIVIPFLDDASVENAIHCWAAMLAMEYEQEFIAQSMELLSPVAMRLELKKGINHCSIINDSYNSDFGSLAIAIDFLNQQNQHPRKTLILSDIFQSGKNEVQLYQEVAQLLEAKQISRVFGIGKGISANHEWFKGDKHFYPTTESFLKAAPNLTFRDEAILIKGARIFNFELISRELQEKVHQTILEVNLSSIVQNLNFFKSRLKPSTQVMAMVKAFSYGSGSYEIANKLQFHHVDYLSVAYADEGVELRKAGITLPILVMNPEEQSFESILTYNLEPEIYSFRILKKFSEVAMRAYRLNPSIEIPIHIKVDTGMKRLGFQPEEIPEMMAKIKNSKPLKIKSVFSHLAGSEDSTHDVFTKEQVAKFTQMTDQIAAQWPQPFMRHILNSAGVIRFPEYQFEMVRLGIGLYGFAPTILEQNQLLPVGTLKTIISQIRNVKAKETVGYSRMGVSDRDMTIGTVAIGYADGIPRSLGNGKGKMLVNGKFARIVGNICMDMAMIDLTEISAKEGDEVLVFGPSYPVHEFAKDAGMIPYEVLTGISQRVKRVYIEE